MLERKMEYCETLALSKLLRTVVNCRNFSTLLFAHIFLILQPLPADTQETRVFPRLFNAAQDKPVVTIPSGSTCGLQQRNAYCKSSIYQDSIQNCRQAFCEQECPRRTSLPNPTDLLVATGMGICVTEDAINRRPGSSGESYAVTFSTGFLCYLTSVNTPSLGQNGAFTLTFWIWMDSQNAG